KIGTWHRGKRRSENRRHACKIRLRCSVAICELLIDALILGVGEESGQGLMGQEDLRLGLVSSGLARRECNGHRRHKDQGQEYDPLAPPQKLQVVAERAALAT